MANHVTLGTATIDRLARGWKVSISLKQPGTESQKLLSQPDHFPTYLLARRWADHIAGVMRLEVVDRTREAANGA